MIYETRLCDLVDEVVGVMAAQCMEQSVRQVITDETIESVSLSSYMAQFS